MQSLAFVRFGSMLRNMSPRILILTILIVCIGWICSAQDHLDLESTALAYQDQGSTIIACWLQPDRAGISAQHRFTQRIGAAVFGGAGSVALDFDGWEKTPWSVGAGFRCVYTISLRVDVAQGRDETVYYVGIGEAF